MHNLRHELVTLLAAWIIIISHAHVGTARNSSMSSTPAIPMAYSRPWPRQTRGVEEYAQLCEESAYFRDIWNVTSLISDRYNITAYTIIYSEEYSSLMSFAYELSEQRLIVAYAMTSEDRQLDISSSSMFKQGQAVLIAVNSALFADIYLQVRQLLTFHGPDMILIVGQTVDRVDNVVEFSDHALILEDSSTCVDCTPQSTSDSPGVISIWAPSHMLEKIERVGSWNSSYGLTISPDLWQFTGFNNKTFNITTLDFPIFHYRIKDDEELRWSGICIEMLKNLAADLDFRYNLIPVPDGNWGSLNEDGEWIGMVGMVHRGEVDFAIATFTITAARDEVIDYTVPFWTESCVFVMKKTASFSLLAFLGPFDLEVWALIALTIPLCGIMYGVASSFVNKISMPSQTSSRKASLEHIKATTLFTFGAYFAQGSCWEPQSWSLRLMNIFWWFFAIIMSATYTGNLIAALAVPGSSIPYDTLQEVADQNEYEIGTVYGTALYSLFQLSEAGVYHDIWVKSLSRPGNQLKDTGEGLEKARKDKFIFINEETSFKAYNSCDMVVGEEKFFPSQFGFVFPENSPYLPFFDAKIQQMIENGLIDHWRRKYMPQDTCVQHDTVLSGATIDDVEGLFLLLAIGAVAAAMLLLLEWFMKPAQTITPVIKFEL